MRAPDESEFMGWAQARRPGLRRLAFTLSTDWHLADDLVQETLTRMYVAWPRLARRGELDGYARRVLVNVYLGNGRRPWRREVPVASLPDTVARGDEGAGDERDLIGALRAVPPGQRAVLALRFLEDLSVEQTAQVLNLSVGTVKSQSSRGLDTLRAILADSAAQGGGQR